MKAADTYSRLYHRFADEFPEVWANDRALATWVRLLRLADATWPTKPPLPRSVRGRPLALLVEQGLVTVIGECFQMRGLEAERSRRKDAAARAADMRWQSARNADALPNRDEKRRDEHKTSASYLEDDDGRADLEAFLLINRRAPSPKQRKLLDDVLALRDVSGPAWAAQVMYAHPDDPIGAVIEADKAWREERIQAAKVVEHKPIRRISKSRGLTGVNAELAAYYHELESQRKSVANE